MGGSCPWTEPRPAPPFARANGGGARLPCKTILRGFSAFFFCSFSFCERKRTKKKAQESAPAIPPRPPVSGACLPRKNILRGFSFRKAPQGKSVLFSFRRKKREPEKKAGNPPGLVRCSRPSAALTFPAKNILRGFFSVLFLSVKEKEHKRKLRNPLGLVRCSRPSAALTFPAKNILRGFSSVLFLSVKEKEPKRKLRNLLRQYRRTRPSAALAFPAKIILRGFSLKSPAGKNG